MNDQFRKILIMRLSSLGDLVLTTPLIRTLRKNFPNAFIAMLTSSEYSAIFSENPHLDRVILLDRGGPEPFETIRILRKVRQLNFDLIIDLHDKFRTRLISKFSGAKTRSIKKKLKKNDLHTVDENLDILREIGIEIESADRKTEIFFSDADLAKTDQNFFRCDENLKIGIFAGASADYKRWRSDRFAEVADRVRNKLGGGVIFFGSKSEIDLVERVREKMKTESISLAGDLTIGELAAAISKCDLFISNDTGPMHIAVAVGVPTIALFGATDHRKFGPIGEPHIAIRHTDSVDRKRGREFLDRITADEVYHAAIKIIPLA